MPRRVAFLRSINVGKRRVKMADLRAHAEDIGFREVSTFIASGNLIYRRGRTKRATDRERWERGLTAALGFAVEAFVRDEERLPEIAACLPFGEPSEGHDVYIGFMKAPVPPSSLEPLRRDGHRFETQGSEIYWRVATKLSESKLQPRHVERELGQLVTFRKQSSLDRLIIALK